MSPIVLLDCLCTARKWGVDTLCCAEPDTCALTMFVVQNQNAAQSTNMATPSGEVYKPSPQPQTADPRFQALESEVANLREHLVAKEGEVEHLTKNQQAVQQQNEDLQRRLVEAENENKRITAELSEAQSTNKKVCCAHCLVLSRLVVVYGTSLRCYTA